MTAKKSSINVLNALYINERQGKAATDLSFSIKTPKPTGTKTSKEVFSSIKNNFGSQFSNKHTTQAGCRINTNRHSLFENEDLKNEENLRLILVFGSPLPSSNNLPSTRSSQEATEPSSPSLTLLNHNYLTLPYNIPEILCQLRKVSCWQFEMVAVDNVVVQALEIGLVDQEQIFATFCKYA
uniref:Uncharacterized protein n=1 Tax=Glossina austeni TaxID=7395 RepID=A0A1A9VRM9_GLOAU